MLSAIRVLDLRIVSSMTSCHWLYEISDDDVDDVESSTPRDVLAARYMSRRSYLL